MGRELKRVPLDFNWPIGQIWKGFVNPHKSMNCNTCEGSGLNQATRKIDADWYAFDNPRFVSIGKNRQYNANAWMYQLSGVEVEALVKGGRIREASGFAGYFDEETGVWYKWVDGEKQTCEAPEMPSAESVNEWAKASVFSHDGINRWICVKARAKHLGVYGHCEVCGSEGCLWANEEVKALHEAWVDFEPPIGDGFQLWSTTTEGHPMSPVFPTLDALCKHLETEEVSLFGKSTATKEQWANMLDSGFVFHQEGNALFI